MPRTFQLLLCTLLLTLFGSSEASALLSQNHAGDEWRSTPKYRVMGYAEKAPGRFAFCPELKLQLAMGCDVRGEEIASGQADYCKGDPVNGYDSDGRIGKNYIDNTNADPNGSSIGYAANSVGSMLYGLLPSPSQWGHDIAGAWSDISQIASDPTVVDQHIDSIPNNLMGDLQSLDNSSLTPQGRSNITTGAIALVLPTVAGKFGLAADAITTPIGELRSAGLADAHHVIQDAAVRDLEGYDTSLAPGVQLQGPSTAVGSEHYLATQAQRAAGGGTYGAERQIAIQSLQASGKYSAAEIDQIMQETDAYFNGIGVNNSTVTRIPGNRR